MSHFRAFVIKEFYHIFRDFRTMLILFGMPVAQILLFGYVITNEIKDANIAIFDKSHDEVTQKISNKLLSSGYFRLKKNISGYGEIEQCFREGSVKEVVVFEEDFGKKLKKEGLANVQILTDASDANTANMIMNFTSAIINDYVRETNPLAKMPMQIVPQMRMFYNPEMKSVFLFVPGIIAMLLMLISALMTSVSITREKEQGTMEVLLVSPLRPLHIIIGKLIPYLVLSIVIVVVVLVLANTVFGLPVQGSILLLFGECILYIILTLSIGVFISTVAQTQQIAIMFSFLALLLPTILLSGFIFPVENMPVVLQWLCKLMPPRYFIIIIKNIMLKGTGFEFVWKETLILCGMIVFFIFLSVRKFKIRLE